MGRQIHGEQIYVETLVRAPMERLWELTQDPAQHTRWDLRFTEISYLPRPDPQQPQEFRYAIRLRPFSVAGVGRTLGETERPDGTRTSALGFGSRNPLSPIRIGRGYWRYVPTDDGVRFLTGFDYDTRWGPVGRLVDRAFRPAMGWATAFSFDRLRLWLEEGTPPERNGIRAAAKAYVFGSNRVVPHARRALRTPPDRTSGTAPRTIEHVEVAV